MKKQVEKIEITDDIIKNKFYEILRDGYIKKPKFFDYDDTLDIEKSKTHRVELIKEMGFDNIDDYSDALTRLNNNSISEEDKSKIKRHKFLTESFVQEVKSSINNGYSNDPDPLYSVYSDAYSKISKIVKDPVTAIYDAIISSDINLTEALLTNLEVDPNTKFNKFSYNNFLEIACARGNKEIVKLLLEKGVNPVIGFYNHVKESKAAEQMGFDNIDDYSKAKAAINDSLTTEEEKNTLNAKIKKHEFLRENFAKEFITLIEDPNIYICDVYNSAYFNVYKIANYPDDYIIKAIREGDCDLVDTLLIALNIDPNMEVSTLEYGTGSLLYFACRNNQKEIARLLLEKGAKVNVGDSYEILLYSVVANGNLDMVIFLLENGANPNYGQGKGKSCLDIATFITQNIAMVIKLLAYGANMEFIFNEKTIFRNLVVVNKYAEVKQDKIDMIEVFLQYGADPDILAFEGQMIRDMESIYEPLRALLTLESAFRRNDYTAIKDIDKKDLAEFIQWKSEIWPVKNLSKNEYIKNLSELITFSKQLNLDDSIKQPLIKLREKIDKLAPSLKFQCLVKTADIIKGDVEGTITFDNELKYNTIMDLLEKKRVSS